MNNSLQAIGERLRTQDNLCTDAPIFAVQQKIRVYGVEDGYAEGHIWIDDDRDHEEVSELKARRLDLLQYHFRDFPDHYKWVGYVEQWEFVTACFTMEGAQEHIRINGHNLRESRVYAYGSFRNPEYRAVRDALMKGEVTT